MKKAKTKTRAKGKAKATKVLSSTLPDSKVTVVLRVPLEMMVWTRRAAELAQLPEETVITSMLGVALAKAEAMAGETG